MIFTLENYLAISKAGQWFDFSDHDDKSYQNLIVHEGSKPTEQECINGIAALQSDYDSREYARNRASAYDSVGNQLDMLMKDMRDGTKTHQESCEAVKTRFPKPE